MSSVSGKRRGLRTSADPNVDDGTWETLPAGTIAINVLPEELEAAADFCRTMGVGAEVTFLASPETLDSSSLSDEVERHRAVLEGVTPLSSHGPFLDLYVTSGDPRIVDVCRTRHETAVRASLALSVQVYVAHLNSVPLINNRSYVDTFIDRAARFWAPLAAMAWEGGATIALENMWERTPELQRRIVETVDHPGLGASFDNGHALVFSNTDATAWIRELGPRLVHCHLHDNDGAYDSHLPVGRGSEKWQPLRAALASIEERPLLVFESDRLADNRHSYATWQIQQGTGSSP